MKLLIGTKNNGKIEGIKKAFDEYYSNIEIESINVKSDVFEQPFNDEILKGAKNRNNNLKEYAKENNIDVDFYISSEAGIINILDKWVNINVVCIENNGGIESIGVSQGFEIPEKYINEIKENDLGKVMDRLFNGNNLGKSKGGINFLTGGRVTRIELVKNATNMALIKFNNNLWM